MSEEVAYRVTCIRSEARKLHRQVFANPKIEMSKRIVVAQSYVFAEGIFQSCTWPDLCKSDFRKMHGAVMDVYRSVSNQRWTVDNGTVSDDSVISQLHAMAPAVMLRMSRVLFFIRWVVKAPDGCVAVVLMAGAASKSWLAHVKKDLAWLSTGQEF